VKIKLDENLPEELAPLLRALAHDIETVPAEQLAGTEDAVIWDVAQAESRFLITQDLDFSDIRKLSTTADIRPRARRLAAP
jgi:predicted nuclease of predicted toxin-antitoxin system